MQRSHNISDNLVMRRHKDESTWMTLRVSAEICIPLYTPSDPRLTLHCSGRPVNLLPSAHVISEPCKEHCQGSRDAKSGFSLRASYSNVIVSRDGPFRNPHIMSRHMEGHCTAETLSLKSLVYAPGGGWEVCVAWNKHVHVRLNSRTRLHQPNRNGFLSWCCIFCATDILSRHARLDTVLSSRTCRSSSTSV